MTSCVLNLMYVKDIAVQSDKSQEICGYGDSGCSDTMTVSAIPIHKYFLLICSPRDSSGRQDLFSLIYPQMGIFSSFTGQILRASRGFMPETIRF